MKRWTLLLLAMLVLPPPGIRALRAQDSLPRFESLLADPRMTGMGARALWLAERDSDLDDDLQAEAILGENLPLLSLQGGAHPIALGGGAAVRGRFGLTAADNPLVAMDWSAEVNLTHRRKHWSFAASLWHESSHLGDEYLQRFPQEVGSRSRDGVRGWAFRQWGAWRVGAGAMVALRVVGPQGRWAAATGADYVPSGTGVRVRAGVFMEVQDVEGVRWAASGRVGVALPIRNRSALVLSVAGYAGPSTLGSFVENQLGYVGLEGRLDL